MSKKPWAKMATEREAVLCVDVPVVVAIRVVGSSGDTHTHCNRHLHFQGTKYSRGRRSALARATRIDSRLAGLWPRSALARANRIDSRLAGLWPRSVFANATRIDSRFAGLWPSPALKSCSSRKSYCWGVSITQGARMSPSAGACPSRNCKAHETACWYEFSTLSHDSSCSLLKATLRCFRVSESRSLMSCCPF